MEHDNYNQLMKELFDKNLSIDTHNYFQDEDGMYIWHFTSSLRKTIFDENDEREDKIIAAFEQGIIIPNAISFCEECEHIGYGSAWELCDSISGDMLDVYETLTEPDGGIKEDIIRELNLSEENRFDSEIRYISEISYENIED